MPAVIRSTLACPASPSCSQAERYPGNVIDQAELGRHHRAYDALMAHWRDAAVAGVMLEVQYEDLVVDFELQARRILDHCGLEWEESCRRFHLTQTSGNRQFNPGSRAALSRRDRAVAALPRHDGASHATLPWILPIRRRRWRCLPSMSAAAAFSVDWSGLGNAPQRQRGGRRGSPFGDVHRGAARSQYSGDGGVLPKRLRRRSLAIDDHNTIVYFTLQDGHNSNGSLSSTSLGLYSYQLGSSWLNSHRDFQGGNPANGVGPTPVLNRSRSIRRPENIMPPAPRNPSAPAAPNLESMSAA